MGNSQSKRLDEHVSSVAGVITGTVAQQQSSRKVSDSSTTTPRVDKIPYAYGTPVPRRVDPDPNLVLAPTVAHSSSSTSSLPGELFHAQVEEQPETNDASAMTLEAQLEIAHDKIRELEAKVRVSELLESKTTVDTAPAQGVENRNEEMILAPPSSGEQNSQPNAANTDRTRDWRRQAMAVWNSSVAAVARFWKVKLGLGPE